MSAADNPLPALVSMRGIVKRFGANIVLRIVDFDVRAGEVHALLGENGAGKSTLMKVLLGIHKPDEGTILVLGEPLTSTSTRARLEAGVAMIFQELSLVPAMSVADNLFLGREPMLFGGRIDRRRIRREATDLIARQGFALDPDARIEDLPFAARQQVEILKALSRGASVIVMDEPTSSLTVREEEVLHATIAQLRAAGIGIVYISHRMSEIFRVADRLSVIKDGQIQGPFATDQITIPEVSRLMARSASVVVMKPKARREPGEIVFEVVGLSTARKLRDIGLAVRAGEIVGIAGLVGSGRSTLAKALFGLIPDARGDVRLGGSEIGALATPPRIRAGMALVPEDRRAEGAGRPAQPGRQCGAAQSCRTDVALAGRPVMATRDRHVPRFSRCAAHCLPRAGPAGLGTVRRQPAEGGFRKMVRQQSKTADPRRANGGCRRQRQGGDAGAGAAGRRKGHGGAADHLGAR
nr:sugar ABC transporter ATP-binding protein [Mesorhizobium huakuii]